MRLRDRSNRLEVVIRLRAPGGGVVAEYTIRDVEVEAVNFYPDGSIHTAGRVSLDAFYAECERIRRSRETLETLESPYA